MIVRLYVSFSGDRPALIKDVRFPEQLLAYSQFGIRLPGAVGPRIFHLSEFPGPTFTLDEKNGIKLLHAYCSMEPDPAPYIANGWTLPL